MSPAAQTPERPDRPGRIGGFEVLSLLGAGGMGVVYEARQARPERSVALKLLHAGADTQAERRRFELEARVLGWLEHPGIARIYEAGTADTGSGERPYLAMELVRGEPIDRWAHARGLDVPARLRLVAEVAEAVHHAHQKGVLHRDLKPGNVLVDEDGRPRVLDFGVARVVDPERREATGATRTGEVLGTLAYMSPEQVRGDSAAIDTRSDVYALGALAHELLAGRPPIDVGGASLPEALRRIAEEEPTRLGARDKRLAGDPETIVAKALSKEPEQRYASAEELARDVRRFLAHEPIRAAPATRTYRLRKFVRRNRALVGGLAAVFVALLGTGLATALLALRLRDERDLADAARTQAELAEARALVEARTADEVTAFLAGLFERANPDAGATGDVTIEQVLDEGVASLKTELVDQPAVRARLLGTLGRVYTFLALYDRSRPLLEEALHLERELHGEDSLEYAAILERMAQWQLVNRSFAKAERMRRQVLETRLRHLEPDHPDLFDARNNLGVSLLSLDRLDEAEEQLILAEKQLDLMEEVPLQKRATLEMNLTWVVWASGREGEAISRLQQAIPVLERDMGPNHPATLTCMYNLGHFLREGGAHAEAIPHLQRALEGHRSLGGAASVTANATQRELAKALVGAGDLEGAVETYRDLRRLYEVEVGTHKEHYPVVLSELGEVLLELGRFDEAEEAHRRAYEEWRRSPVAYRPDALRALGALARVHAAAGRLDEAEELYQQRLDAGLELGEGSPEATEAWVDYGRFLVECERLEEAELLLQEAEAGLTDEKDPERVSRRAVAAGMADLYEAWGRPEEASAWRVRTEESEEP